MNREMLVTALNENKDDLFNLKKFNMDNLKISDCSLEKDEDNDYFLVPTKNKRKRKYIYQCQMCNRFFLGGKDKSGVYVGNCYKNFDEERDFFYTSDLKITDKKKKEGLHIYSVNDLLEQIKNDSSKKFKNVAGVWALWNNFGSEGEECIQVAKNVNIYQEIYDNFCKSKGSIDYKEYRDTGTIVIVSESGSDFLVEAQYAHDYKAKKWNLKFGEPKTIGIEKGLRK